MAQSDALTKDLMELEESVKAVVKRDLEPRQQDDMDVLVAAFFQKEVWSRGHSEIHKDFPTLEAVLDRFGTFLQRQGR